ncbi:hypothetical protein PAEPH01_1783 [Pancytospora epiphaga]|nr:hypothetical protein PAEPH01_1783 [Pancytospora epiphaga]
MHIIPYAMTWGGAVTKYYKRHLKDIGITKSYIQIILLKKTLECIFFKYRRGAKCFNGTGTSQFRAEAYGRSSNLPGTTELKSLKQNKFILHLSLQIAKFFISNLCQL